MDGDEQRESNRVRPIVGPRNVRQAQEDTTHAVPQSKMGDFESYMLRNPPLRFAYEEEERLANLTMFGNPFKKLPGELVSPINDDQVDESGAATALKQVQVRRSRSMTTRDSRIGEPRKNASLALTEDVTRVSVEKWAECGKVHEEAIMRYRIADFEPVASPAEFIATMAGMARGGEREDAAASTRRPSVDIPEELDDIPPPPPPPSDYPSSPPAMPLPPPAKKIRVDAVPARVGSSMASSCSSLDPASRKMLLNIIRRYVHVADDVWTLKTASKSYIFFKTTTDHWLGSTRCYSRRYNGYRHSRNPVTRDDTRSTTL